MYECLHELIIACAYIYVYVRISQSLYVCMYVYDLCDGLGAIALCQSYEAACLCHKLAHIGIIQTYVHE